MQSHTARGEAGPGSLVTPPLESNFHTLFDQHLRNFCSVSGTGSDTSEDPQTVEVGWAGPRLNSPRAQMEEREGGGLVWKRRPGSLVQCIGSAPGCLVSGWPVDLLSGHKAPWEDIYSWVCPGWALALEADSPGPS